MTYLHSLPTKSINSQCTKVGTNVVWWRIKIPFPAPSFHSWQNQRRRYKILRRKLFPSRSFQPFGFVNLLRVHAGKRIKKVQKLQQSLINWMLEMAVGSLAFWKMCFWDFSSSNSPFLKVSSSRMGWWSVREDYLMATSLEYHECYISSNSNCLNSQLLI